MNAPINRLPRETFTDWIVRTLEEWERMELAARITSEAQDAAGYEPEDERGRR